MTVNELTTLLGNKNQRIRQQAVRDASDTPLAGMVVVFAALLDSSKEQFGMRRTAVCGLGRSALPAAQSHLENALANDPDPFVRSGAAQWLGRRHWSKDKLDYAAANDPDKSVREMARMAWSLGG